MAAETRPDLSQSCWRDKFEASSYLMPQSSEWAPMCHNELFQASNVCELPFITQSPVLRRTGVCTPMALVGTFAHAMTMA